MSYWNLERQHQAAVNGANYRPRWTFEFTRASGRLFSFWFMCDYLLAAQRRGGERPARPEIYKPIGTRASTETGGDNDPTRDLRHFLFCFFCFFYGGRHVSPTTRWIIMCFLVAQHPLRCCCTVQWITLFWFTDLFVRTRFFIGWEIILPVYRLFIVKGLVYSYWNRFCIILLIAF